MDDIKPKDQLTEKIKHCQGTARNLKEEFESLLQQQKSIDTKGDSNNSVKQTPPSNDVTKQMMDIDLAIESIQQQLKLVLEQYLSTQSDLPTSADRPMIQNDANQMEDAKFTINHLVKLSNDNNGQNEAKLNPTVQALFTGTLPDDFFLHLLSVMGIQECLLSNRLVCSLWNELVLERCHNQKSLKLFETFDNLMEYGELLLKYEKTNDPSLILKSIGDDLLFEGLEIDHEQLFKSLNQEDEQEILTREKKLEASKVLTALFPKIEDLVLCPSEPNTLINIEHLLQFYSEQLTSLTMTKFEGLDENSSNNFGAFSFPKLKSLNTFNFSPEEDQLLSLLPQLESLTVESTEISLETLLRTGSQLQELNIDEINSVYTAPEDEFLKCPPINSNLRKFSLDGTLDESQALEFISLNLTSLECLKLNFYYYEDKLDSVTSHLVPLHQLHSLTLLTPVLVFLLDNNQLAEIQPLQSVRQLKLILCDFDSLSIDLFSRVLFTAFPKVEQVLIAFFENCEDGRVDNGTFAAFEDFAGKHPNVVQLFRSKDMSMFTALPNAVSPLLGHHRQVYEEYIEEEELFGVAICKLTASLVKQEGEDDPNLKITLRPADRLTALSNFFQLLERDAFVFPLEMVKTMIEQMSDCALNYAPSQDALFIVTCKCVLSLLGCNVVDTVNSDTEEPFLGTEDLHVYSYFEMILKLVDHYRTQQLDDKSLLLQLYKRLVQLLTEFDSFWDNGQFDEFKMLKILLKLANYYQTEQLNALDNDEGLLFLIDNLICDQLEKFESEERLDTVIIKLLRSKNLYRSLYRVEIVKIIRLQNREFRFERVRALTRACKSAVSYLKLLSGEADSDSSDGSSSSAESEPEL